MAADFAAFLHKETLHVGFHSLTLDLVKFETCLETVDLPNCHMLRTPDAKKQQVLCQAGAASWQARVGVRLWLS